ADRMLDMGFIPDVERIISFITKKHQTLLFSATMPPEIRRLANRFLTEPKEITVGAPSSVVDTVEQALVIVPHSDKRNALRTLLHSQNVKNALIFCNRKRDIGVLHRSLERHGFNAGALHGDMDQFQRMDTLDKFKSSEIQILVCSDVAARGLDIAGVSHVFNFDVPTHPEDYVHRIGRTGRAGRTGHAFTLAAPEDGKYVAAIERLAGKKIPRVAIGESAGPELKEEGGRDRGRGRGRGRGADKRPSEKPEQTAEKQDEKRSTEAEKQPKRAEKQAKREKDGKRGSRRGRDSIGDVPDYGDVPFGETDQVPAFLKRTGAR
ncbi:MAG: DEAD/DEAH box helicase, partial [Alphaproteobacteria bacterium]|nr:DEAD/DEAH box helicase [Alphaproteobacteria bacterium]